MCLNFLETILNENIEKKSFFFNSQVTHKQYIYKQVYQISDTYMTYHCRCQSVIQLKNIPHGAV